MADGAGHELPDFKSRIAGFQAIVSGENKGPSIGGAVRSVQFVQKLKRAWQGTKETDGNTQGHDLPYAATAQNAATKQGLGTEHDSAASEHQVARDLNTCVAVDSAKRNEINALAHSNTNPNYKDSKEYSSVPQALMREVAVSMEVVGCPSVAVLGRNRVYLSSAVHARFAKIQSSLLGTPNVASEPVLICINRYQFEAWAAPEMKDDTVALDSVQALTVSACLGEVVQVWPLDISHGLCQVYACTFSVRVKDKSSHMGLDKNKFSEHCFKTLQGHPLCLGQRILVGFGYWRMEVCVDRIDDPWTQVLAAFHMGSHPRLGTQSWVSRLPQKALVLVSQLFWRQACRSTLVGPSCKLFYNFWNGSIFEGSRTAEGVCGIGYEEVLIRGVGSDSMSPKPSHTDGSSQAARPAEQLVAPFFQSTYHLLEAPLPLVLAPWAVNTSPSLEAAPQPRSSSREWQMLAQGFGSPDPPSPRHAGSPSNAHSSRLHGTVSSSKSSAEEMKAKMMVVRDMLINAGLEHEETLLQLDEMSALAAASLQRENKYVKLISDIVSRNQAKGGDWAHLAHLLEDYSEDILDCLQIVEREDHQQARMTNPGHANRHGELQVL